MKGFLLKLMLSLSMLILMIGCSFAEGTGTLSHLGFSVLRQSNTTLVKVIQANGSLMPSVDREIAPYTEWKKRLYGFVGIEPTGNQNYCYGAGYYLGRVGTFGVEISMLNNKELEKDKFVCGIYTDGNVFKSLLKNIGLMLTTIKE